MNQVTSTSAPGTVNDGGGFWHAVKTWPLRGFFALLDQGLISGSNFILAILLARWVSPQQYGAYALAFEVLLFMSIVYGALILEPMCVFGPSTYKNDFRAYLGILLRIHCGLSVLVIAAVFAGAAVLHAIKPGSSLPNALVGVGVACPCLLLFWLARRGFYVHLLPRKAALGACAYSATVLAGVTVVYKVRSLTPLTVFLVMAAGAVVTGPPMLRWFKSHMAFLPGRRIRVREVMHQHWIYGRWALASAIVIWLSGAVYYPALGSFFSLAETGRFKALMNLGSPIGQAYVALSLLSLPYASQVHHAEGNAVVGRLVWKLTGLYLGGSILYWLIVILARGPIVQHLYGGKYTQVIALLPWVALGSVLRIGATAQANVLRAMRSPSMVFVAYSAACVVAILVGIPCTRWFGLRGALFAWVLSGAASFVGALWMIRRKARRSEGQVEFVPSSLVLQEEPSMSAK
ncbi:MAG: lipopolysaccharide biosynthesis protein [Terriglobia bacterium]